MMDKGSYALGTAASVANQDPEFRRIMRQLRNARTKTVLHHETCPRCGAKLVNLYRQSPEDSVWMCKKCWDKHEEAIKEASDSLAGNDVALCKTCQVYAKAVASSEPAACKWYVDNVVLGSKSTKSCPNYKPVEGE